ncbi:MAG: bifunctional methylenetetrahydrofolate dehydrogenase/methenyltetrahydrofolate cyclohydrolase [Harvfovirus sp.]|uniref:Bifunctional methylenetetrahydrofolate dehydrogenase/methenyltetrahydrofolate cyclohydrolase n=1 Tax=Harvfovirus sp. TaxID=2487768 RepID=A0A3G4ZZZ8_9VIRU|nr:MAG: bifunctional methylenetetrahydrofolate dehydrogenase/methenyltetrahydrofolate cyclohydrolase [Harvfovirus sp.]
MDVCLLDMAKILSGGNVALLKLNKLKDDIKGLELCLAIIQIGVNVASSMCIKLKQNKCKEIGIQTKLFHFDDTVEENDVINLVRELNSDNSITGIILQLPIPKKLSQFKIIETIDFRKDVDGLTSYNMGCLLLGEANIIPATSCAILDLLDYYEIDVSGKFVVIMGRSNLVSKPTALLLQMRNATVMNVHTATVDLVEFTQRAEILIVACGVKSLVKRHMIRRDAIIIDVGINKTDSGVVGDVDYKDVIDMVKGISPVPGGVGPLTVANMICNTYRCYRLQGRKIETE